MRVVFPVGDLPGSIPTIAYPCHASERQTEAVGLSPAHPAFVTKTFNHLNPPATAGHELGARYIRRL